MTSLKPVMTTKDIISYANGIPDDLDIYADEFDGVKWVRQDKLIELHKRHCQCNTPLGVKICKNCEIFKELMQ